MRRQFEALEQKQRPQSFGVRKAAWQAKGHPACRHGVFLTGSVVANCPCMRRELPLNHERERDEACFMLITDANLRCITVVLFQDNTFKKLRQLQAEMRRQGW